MDLKDILLITINFAGALAVFFYAMKLMSEELQKAAGSRMRALLAKISDRPLSGILTGIAVTAAIQSSPATTVMVVGFVSAHLRAAYDAEHAVNTLRDRLLAEHIEALKANQYGHSLGTAYGNLVAQYEKLADHVINVSEAIG